MLVLLPRPAWPLSWPCARWKCFLRQKPAMRCTSLILKIFKKYSWNSEENIFSSRNLQCKSLVKEIFLKNWKSAEHYLARWNIAWMKKICKQYFKKMSRMFEVCWNLHRLKFAPILQYYCYYYRKCKKYPKKCERLKIHLKMVSPASTRPISSCSLSRAM